MNTESKLTWIVVISLCLVGTLWFTTAIGLAGTPEEHTRNASDNGTNGLSYNETISLWSGDPDVEPSQSVYENLSTVEALVWVTDVPSTEPPKIQQTWNRNDFTEWLPGGGNTSRYPESVMTSDSRRGWIKDAHATQFHQQPSTLVYVNDSETVRYTAREGSVLGVVDYRIDTPSNTSTPDERRLYSLKDHEVAESCILEADSLSVPNNERICDSPKVIETADGGHRNEFNYSSTRSPGAEVTHGFGAEIQVTYNRTTRENKSREVCTTRNTSQGNVTTCNTEYYWETTESKRVTDTLSVLDKWNVTIYYIPAAQTKAASYPNGDIGVWTASTVPINGYSYPAGKITSYYSFFTHRDSEWDKITNSSATKTSTSHSQAHPVQVVAIPSSGGYYSTSDIGFAPEIVDKLNTQSRTAPKDVLPENIQASVPQDYVDAKVVVARGAVAESLSVISPDLATVEANGLVNGETTDVADLSKDNSVQNIRKSNLSLEKLTQNQTHITVYVNLTDDETGEPIDTSKRDGYIKFGKKKFNTNTTGEAVVRISRTYYGIATYRPASWWTLGTRTPYSKASATVTITNQILNVQALIGIFSRILMLALPFLAIAYAIDDYVFINTWPPWRFEK